MPVACFSEEGPLSRSSLNGEEGEYLRGRIPSSPFVTRLKSTVSALILV